MVLQTCWKQEITPITVEATDNRKSPPVRLIASPQSPVLGQKHGPLMLLHIGTVPTLVVSSADAAREIMKTHDLIFADRPQSSVSRRLLYDFKDVSVAPYGEYWRQLKSICVLQLLSNKRVQSFHSIREEETALLVNKIRNSTSPVNLSEMFAQITNEWFVGLSWISRVNGFDARVDKVSKEMDDFLEGVIRERMETPEKNKNGENFVDILLDIYQSNSSAVSIDRDSIKAIILDVYAAGIETTSTVLEWAMTELLRHPSVMKKLQAEDFDFIPFGAGRRGCPGIAFAMATKEFVLANLVQKFDWKLPEGKELDMKERPGVTVRIDVPLLAAATQYHS
ncbi:UNVERIFIED_CONTAM: cytochrome [Sesamum radiatum]|uniref:Cytochrome n=1 Tax=Sesamum radiatum TaxID=300843 RepID=A0AAW2PL93_SESRA